MPHGSAIFRIGFSALLILFLAHCSQKTAAQYVQEGRNLTEDARYPEAMSAFARAAEIDPKNPDAHYGLGGLYNQKENYPEAEKAFRAVIRLDPTYVDAYYSLGYTYEMMGKSEEARQYYDQFKSLRSRLDRLLDKPSGAP